MNEIIEIIKKNKFLVIITIAITIVHIIYASLSQRGAYLDGASWVLRLLNSFSENQYSVATDIDHTRFMPNLINQLPMVIGYFIFSIKSKYWLSVIFSFGLFVFPPFILWWNYHLSKRTQRFDIFTLNTFVYGGILLTYSIFGIVEMSLVVMLHFVLLNYLAGKIDYTKIDIFLISLLLIVSFSSHEYMIFLGPILFLASLYYAKKEENLLNKKTKYFIGIGALLASIFTFIYMFLQPSPIGESLRFFNEGIDFWKIIYQFNLILTIATLALIILILFKKNHLSKFSKILICSLYAGILYHMFNNLEMYLSPMYEGHTRTIPCWAVPLIFSLILALDFFKRTPSKIIYSNIISIALICTISHTIWQINNTYWFNKNIEYMQNELAKYPGPLYIPEDHEEKIATFFHKDLRRYIWNFSFTATSILFAPDKNVKTILIQPTEDLDNGGNILAREWLYIVINEKELNCPGARVLIVNQFWNLTKVAKALKKYNKKNDIQTISEA